MFLVIDLAIAERGDEGDKGAFEHRWFPPRI